MEIEYEEEPILEEPILEENTIDNRYDNAGVGSSTYVVKKKSPNFTILCVALVLILGIVIIISKVKKEK